MYTWRQKEMDLLYLWKICEGTVSLLQFHENTILNQTQTTDTYTVVIVNPCKYMIYSWLFCFSQDDFKGAHEDPQWGEAPPL